MGRREKSSANYFNSSRSIVRRNFLAFTLEGGGKEKKEKEGKSGRAFPTLAAEGEEGIIYVRTSAG